MSRLAGANFVGFTVWGLLGLMLVAIVGIPLPKTARTITEPYPCQDRACGCPSAEHCWDKCCCHSDAEKLAWAAKHGVSPPSFLLERVAKQLLNASKSACDHETATCASGGCTSEPVAKATQAQPAAKSCCSSKPACDAIATTKDEASAESGSENAESPAPEELRIVLLDAAAKCRGIDLVWNLLSIAMVGKTRPIVPAPEPPLVGWLRVFDETAPSSSHGPESPVPILVV